MIRDGDFILSLQKATLKNQGRELDSPALPVILIWGGEEGAEFVETYQGGSSSEAAQPRGD